jgi:2-pyrone-4,6-dicarboxylate lactonase
VTDSLPPSSVSPSAPPSAPLCAPFDPEVTPPGFAVPAGACDCHAHICGPATRYPYAEERIYTPPDALAADYFHMLGVLGLDRGVLVQPSVYGTDNRALLDVLRTHPQRLRGVAVVDPEVDSATLGDMHVCGIRGVRCNIVDLKEGKGQLPMDTLRRLAERVRPLGWHIELLMHVDEFPDLDTSLGSLGVPVVFGHLGYAPAAQPESEGFRAMLRLMQAGIGWAKLTGPYRLTPGALPYPAVDAVAARLVQAAPERLLWGSDWPHVMVKTGMPGDGALLDLLATWVPDAGTRCRILVDNPAQLYGFPAA